MARCDSCKFWDVESGKRAGSLQVGNCRKALAWWDATEWVDSADDEWDNQRRLLPEHEGTKMFVQDGSDFMADLYTTADFFCAHFDQR